MQPILYVDDKPLNRKLVRDVFEAQRVEIDLAESAKAAMKMLGLKKYKTVITDLMMPYIDGFALGEYIGCNYPHLNLFFVTFCYDLKGKIDSTKYGANFKGFIERPLTPTKVRMKLGLPCPNNVLQFNKGVV